MRRELRPRRVCRVTNDVCREESNTARRMAQGAGRKGIFSILTPVSCLLIPAVFLLAAVLAGCSPQQKQPGAPQDKPLANFQTNLLHAAFEIATAIPVYPHIKDRSRSQEAVVTACFDLDQPQRALGYIEKIGDWRRGAGYADYAFYCVENGYTEGAESYLEMAREIAAIADQDWRRDRIKIKMARVRTLLGQTEQADDLEEGVEPSEAGKVARVEAVHCEESQFESLLTELDLLFSAKNFDITKNALFACTELYSRFFGNPARRAQLEEKIKQEYVSVPVFLQIELLMKLSDGALSHADAEEALRLYSEAKEVFDRSVWPPQHGIPLAARLAKLRYRCGAHADALSDLKAALDQFAERQNEIVNIYKAETLIPVAEAYQAVGDTATAVSVYKQAAEAAVENPNSRPQAEDLSAICLSMAVKGVEPDEALWNRIKELQAKLGDPW